MLITMANLKSVRGVLTVAGFFFLTSSPPAQGQGARQTESVQPQKNADDPGGVPLNVRSEAEVPAAKTAKVELPTTEKMLMMAMESNPDILVAKAKLREAEAELNRTRLQVTRQIMTLGEFVRSQRALVNRLRAARQNVSIGEIEKAATELSATEAELQYTLGQSPLNDATGK